MGFRPTTCTLTHMGREGHGPEMTEPVSESRVSEVATKHCTKTLPTSLIAQGLPRLNGFEVAPACFDGVYTQSLRSWAAHPQGAGLELQPKEVSSIDGKPNADDILMKK